MKNFKVLLETIVKRNGSFLLMSKKGKVLGKHESEAKARKQEAAIKISTGEWK
jgi:hypothetical protein